MVEKKRNSPSIANVKKIITLSILLLLVESFVISVYGELPGVPSDYKERDIPDSVPPSGKWPKGDADSGRVEGDVPPPAHTNDWRLDREVDDKGNDIDLWVRNESHVIYYALIFSNSTGRYLIGKCPFEGGRNLFAKKDTGDTNPKNGNPDEFTGAWWRSRDTGKDDDNDGKGDAWVYTFDVRTNKVTADHYEAPVHLEDQSADGEYLKSYEKKADSVPPKEPKKAPFTFTDLPPANPGVNYTYGDYMYPEVEAVVGLGGITLSVDKFGLLAPYIGLTSTILVATIATAIYVKRVKHKEEKQ